ncbi:MAG: hypothetical protein KC443_20695 [Anaerolineales bacterium]|nr:hypothetical protein [Anaerolineales bacterium]
MNWLRQRDNQTALLLFLLLALLFMNKALFPPAGQVLGGYDMHGYYTVLHEAVRKAVHEGTLPFWDPYRFDGNPLLADPQQNAFYPPAWLTIILPTNVGISWYMLLHIWLASVGMYAFVRRMAGNSQESWLPGLLAGVAFAYSGLLAGRLWAGHSTVYAIDSWLPWLLLALHWSVQKERWETAVLAGLPFALCILAGHLPSFLYIGLAWGAFALYLWVVGNGRRLLVVRQSAIMLIVGLALATIQLAPFVQFSLASSRVAEADYEFATDYSLPPAHLITLIVPEFFGEPTRTGYWSVPTFEELTYYAGILALLGILLALRRPNRLTWFYVLLMVGGLWLALGRYGVLYKFAFDWLPPFRLVRAPGRAAFLFLTAATALLGHALTQWMTVPLAERREQLASYWRWSLSVFGVALFAALAATGAVFMAVHPTDTSGRLWQQIGGYSIALVMVVVGGSLLWAYLTTPDTRRRRWFGGALLLLSVADMWLFSFKMVRLQPMEPDALWLETKAMVGDRVEKVLPWAVPEFSQSFSLSTEVYSIFGYASMQPEDTIALASSVPDPRSSAYDVLGAAYVVSPVPLDQFTEGERPLTLIEQSSNAWIYRRGRVLPVARLVYAAEVIPDAETAVARVHQPDFDPVTTAIIDTAPTCSLGAAPPTPGTAEIVETKAGYWRIQTQSTAPALLLLAENAYPGWQVTVDGTAAEGLKAYTAVRAVCVPAGEHVVEWQFEPTIYWFGGGITLVTLLALFVALIRYRKP